MSRVVLIPAAGASSRMRDADKLMMDVAGAPCLRVMAKRAMETADHVIVTLPHADHPRAAALSGLAVEVALVPEAQEGMAASLRAGALAARDASALMVLLPDMPSLCAEDLQTLWKAYGALPSGQILRAADHEGRAGHPVIFPAEDLRAFAQLSGDRGAAPILQQSAERVHLHRLQSKAPTQDLDTPEDWALFRRASRQAE